MTTMTSFWPAPPPSLSSAIQHWWEVQFREQSFSILSPMRPKDVDNAAIQPDAWQSVVRQPVVWGKDGGVIEAWFREGDAPDFAIKRTFTDNTTF